MLNKNLKPWIHVKPDSDFSIHNIPFGVYTDKDVKYHACTAIGDYIIDLFEMESADLLDINRSVFEKKTLNSFIRLGKKATNRVRTRVQEILCDSTSILNTDKKFFAKVFKKR